MAANLELRAVTKRRGDFFLKGIDLTLESGSVLGFIGPNGAGKTTLIKIIMGLLIPDSGEVRLFGEDAAKRGSQLRAQMGFVYDEGRFNGKLNAEELGSLVGRFYPTWSAGRYAELLERLELPRKKPIDGFSKGMKMKLQLAAALSHDARLIVMDEPTGGLDPVVRSEILDLLYREIQDERKSILFSTHVTDDLARIADRVAFIDRGELIFVDAVDTVLETRSLVKGPAAALTAELETLLVGVRRTGTSFSGLTEKADAVRTLGDPRIVLEPASLEDIMVYTVRRDYRC